MKKYTHIIYPYFNYLNKPKVFTGEWWELIKVDYFIIYAKTLRLVICVSPFDHFRRMLQKQALFEIYNNINKNIYNGLLCKLIRPNCYVITLRRHRTTVLRIEDVFCWQILWILKIKPKLILIIRHVIILNEEGMCKFTMTIKSLEAIFMYRYCKKPND